MVMTAPHGGPMGASLDVPQSQNTAPVLEFRCLYTADIRRKQKRWQDGRLKFHTFNKRVMVYDERSNFVGDTHWKGGLDFDEGEELELERGGILVEVGQCIGKRDQDLSELVDKRVKEREERAAAKAAVSPSASLLWAQSTPAGAGLLRPKPSNAMLTPTSYFGRAVIPNTSPFEEKRIASGKRDENEPPAKRRRQNETTSSKNGYAQNLMGATLSLSSSKPSSTPTIRYEPFKTRPMTQQTPADAIDLTMDNEEDRRAADERRRIAREKRISMAEMPIAKQKRQKRSPPARSGYASNLTGTPLMLSKPEARASSKIITAKPSNQIKRPETEDSPSETAKVARKPVAAVQVRNQEPEDSSAENEDNAVGIPSPSPSPPKTKKKSGEASGKARVLERNDSSSPAENSFIEPVPEKVAAKVTKKARKAIAQSRHVEGEKYSLIEEDSFSDIDPTPKPTSRAITKRKEANAKGMPSKAIQRAQSRSSSPPRTDFATPALQNDTICRRNVVHNPSSIGATPDRPLSGLRIKSRAPRKMMMLMERPSSRSSAPSDSFGQTQANPRLPETPKVTSSEAVLSQATLDLNAFCKKHDAALQARLKGTRPMPHLGEISSSNPNDINNQTIDALLSYKSVPIQKQPEPVRTALPKPNPIYPPKPPSVEIEQRLPLKKQRPTRTDETNKTDGCEEIDVPPKPPPMKPTVEERGDGERDSRASEVPQQASKEVNATSTKQDLLKKHVQVTPATTSNDKLQSEAQVSRRQSIQEDIDNDTPKVFKTLSAHGYPGSTQSNAICLQRLAPVSTKAVEPADNTNILPFNQPQAKEVPDTRYLKTVEKPHSEETVNSGKPSVQDQAKPLQNYMQSDIQKEDRPMFRKVGQQAMKMPALSVGRKPKELPEHIISVVQSATVHFRALLKPSASSTDLIAGATTPPTESNISRPSDPVKGEPVSGERAIKPSPKLSPPIGEALNDGQEPCSGPGFSPANSLTATSAALLTPDLAVDNSRMGPPRARLANPATRGKSLQTLAASTVDTMNPLFNPLPPPAPRMSSRTERNQAIIRNDNWADKSNEGLARETLADGPWSREAFDLFGLHGPPKGNTGTKVPAT